MAIRFIIGRSGSGKTYYCLETIKKQLLRSAQGHPLILLVPEQATFQMEQALLGDSNLRGYNRAYVFSFNRMARQILQQGGPPSMAVLSEFGKQMILRRLLQERQGQLRIFDLAAAQSGFVIQLSRAISELRQYQQSPDQLRRQREQLLQMDDPATTPLAEKLADLALIYSAYQEYIAERYIDPDDFLDLAVSKAQDADFIHGGKLWVDGFAGFTPQQYRLLSSVVGCVEQAHISLCLDPRSRQFQTAHKYPNEPKRLDQTDLFHPTLKTYQKLIRLFGAAVDEPAVFEPPMILPAGPEQTVDARLTMPRFQGSADLGKLERDFLTSNASTGNNEQNDLPATGYNDSDIPVRDVVVVEALNRRREVDAAAMHILKLCRQHDYRFRDIAVILRDITDYQELLEAAFTDYGIAYFIDHRRSVHHHPLVELLRCTLRVLISDFYSEDVIAYLKTDLVPIDRWAVDMLENYCLAHHVQADHWISERPWKLRPDNDNKDSAAKDLTNEQLNQYRRQGVAALLKMRANLYPQQYQPEEQLSVREITAQIVQLLDGINVSETLTRWYRQARDNGNPDEAQVHEQLYNDVTDRLDDIVEALGESRVTLTEYSEILCSALEQTTLRLIPPGLDQVLIGTIERSRHPHIRAAFVLGVNEKQFPKVSSPDAFFTDPQRELLERRGFELAPTSTEKLLNERYLAYIALTRPREFLWVSYAAADEKATALNPSMFIENIFEANANRHFVRLPDETSGPNTDHINTPAQLTEQLARAFSAVKKTTEQTISPEQTISSEDITPTDDRSYQNFNPIWPELYHYCLGSGEWSDYLGRGLAGLRRQKPTKLKPQVTDRLFSRTLQSSVSRLESFAACPFQYFARYTLRLREREELRLGALDMGSFYHDALFHIFQRLRGAGLDWRDVTDEKLDSLIAGVMELLVKQKNQLAQLKEQSSRNRFMLAEAAEYLGSFCRGIRTAVAAGNFHQRHAELEFGDTGTIPGLNIELPNGRRLVLRGKIDRVDTCLKKDGSLGISVIDYKSSAKQLAFDEFYHGLSLQLISYLLVLQKNYPIAKDSRSTQTGKFQPAAALYLPINRQGQSHQEAPPDDILNAQSSQKGKPQKAAGIISNSWVNELDYMVQPKRSSDYYGFYMNKDGSAYNSRSKTIVAPDEMSALLGHCEKKLAELAGEILSGNISVAPYRLGGKRTPCQHCDFASLCRFDSNIEPYRDMTRYSKQEVIEKI